MQISELISQRCHQAMDEVKNALLQIDLQEEDCACMVCHNPPHFDPRLFELILLFSRHNRLMYQIYDVEGKIRAVDDEANALKEAADRITLSDMRAKTESLAKWRDETFQKVRKELGDKFKQAAEDVSKKYDEYNKRCIENIQNQF